MGDSSDSAPYWSGAGFVRQTYELQRDDTVAAELRFTTPFHTRAVGESGGCQWVFEPDGLTSRRVVVRDALSQSPVVRLVFRRPTSCELEVAGQVRFRVEGTWGSSWVYAEDGRELIQYWADRPGDLGHQVWWMAAQDAVGRLRDAKWLPIVGWYVTVRFGWNRPAPSVG